MMIARISREASWGPDGDIFEPSRGPPGGLLGASSGLLEGLWGPPGGRLGASSRSTGDFLGACWGFLEACLLGASPGGKLEISGRGPPLGPLLGPSWGSLGLSWAPLGPPRGPTWGGRWGPGGRPGAPEALEQQWTTPWNSMNFASLGPQRGRLGALLGLLLGLSGSDGGIWAPLCVCGDLPGPS
eukprot:5749523-Pyramimonas_sp.AAC.1